MLRRHTIEINKSEWPSLLPDWGTDPAENSLAWIKTWNEVYLFLNSAYLFEKDEDGNWDFAYSSVTNANSQGFKTCPLVNGKVK